MGNNTLDGMSGVVRARVRLAKRDNEEGDAPDWRPEEIVTLHIERRDVPLKRRGRIVEPAGTLLVMNIQEHPEWAEYSAHHDCGDGEWLCEQYRMEILEIIGGQK